MEEGALGRRSCTFHSRCVDMKTASGEFEELLLDIRSVVDCLFTFGDMIRTEGIYSPKVQILMEER